jgi:hypothetical protein
LLSSNCCPWITSILFIEIITVGSGGGIIAIAVAVAVAVAIAVAVAVADTVTVAIAVAIANTVTVAIAIAAIAIIAVITSIVNIHRRCPITVIKSLPSNQRPPIAAIVVINIVAISGSGGIIAAAVAGHHFILCGTEITKIISTRYKSYGLVDLYQFLRIKCVLPVQFLNLPFHWSTTYITNILLANPQPTTRITEQPKWTTAALPSSGFAPSLCE